MTQRRPLRPVRGLARFLRDTRGGTAIEYGLILALVVIAMMASLIGVAGETRTMWNTISTRMSNAN